MLRLRFKSLKKPKKILIVSQNRSGSTFVSDYIHNFSKKFHFDFECNISKRNISE